MVDIEVLKKFSLFKELNEAELQKFADHMQEKQYSKKALVCSKGDQGDEIFFVKKGKASVVLPLYRYDSKYKNVSVLEEGDFFGELSFFDGQERSADVRAVDYLELLSLSRREYDRIIKDNLVEGCRIQSKIIAGLAGIIREMNETYSSARFLF